MFRVGFQKTVSLVAAAILLGAAGCEPDPPEDEPGEPPGFDQAYVPDGESGMLDDDPEDSDSDDDEETDLDAPPEPVDAESPERFEESVRQITEAMSEQERHQLQQAMVTIGMIKSIEADRDSYDKYVDLQAQLRENVAGMTADEIVEMADELKEDYPGLPHDEVAVPGFDHD